MEEMEIHELADIPDTPDRIAVQRAKRVQLDRGKNLFVAGRNSGFVDEGHVDQPAASSMAVREIAVQRAKRVQLDRGKNLFLAGRNSGFVDEGHIDQPAASSMAVRENGHNRRLQLHPQRNQRNISDTEHQNKSLAFSPLRKSHSTQQGPLFRRRPAVSNAIPQTKHSVGAQNVDKGKAVCTKVPSNSSGCLEDDTSVDLTEQNDIETMLDWAFPRSADKTGGGQISSSGESALHSSRISCNTSKGKSKVVMHGSSGSSINNESGTVIGGGSQSISGKHVSASHHIVAPPRVNEKRKLVRNGCICPHNIASRAQNTTNVQQVGSAKETNHSRKMLSDGPLQIHSGEIVAEDNNYGRARGKGVITHPATSNEHDVEIVHVPNSSGLKLANGSSHENGNASNLASLGSWRSTRNNGRRRENSVSCMDGHSLGRDDAGSSVNERCQSRPAKRANGGGIKNSNSNDLFHFEDQSTSQTAGPHQMSGLCQVGNRLPKRQKRTMSRNHGECSTMLSDSQTNTRSSTIPDHQLQSRSGPIYEIDELSPQMRNSESQGMEPQDNIEADARAWQVVADELLARELQEQLYNETPVLRGAEIDGNIARALEQEEEAVPASSSRNHRVSHRRNLRTMVNSFGHPQQPSFRNPSSRRRTQVELPATRRSQLRNHLVTQRPTTLSRNRDHFPAALSRGRDFHFPSSLDLDMRIDILEALEEAVGDFDALSMRTSHVLQSQRDFNENDYEMLLALDENNHQHGASRNLINSLPESKVQTENLEEACAICLETPTTGEKIRHLPCLHKFHKDCIDPWLSRKPSCPICKSEIVQ